MLLRRRILASLLMLLAAAACAWAQLDTLNADTLDSYTRENPDMGTDMQGSSELPYGSASYGAYPFLRLQANTISLNGDDWSDLRQLFRCCEDTLISIVHIGDSHIQAEGATTRTRSLLQQCYGNAGRGLIIPFKLAGTNEPRDYIINTSSPITTAKILKRPWPHEMGFTGISLKPSSRRYSITISDREIDGVAHPFEAVKIFGCGSMPKVLSAKMESGAFDDFEDCVVADTLCVFLSQPVQEITLDMESRGDCCIFGFLLDNYMAGVQYSAIGNNGATFSSYNDIGSLGQGIYSLAPNLVIISLGTNEAFGSISDDAMYASIDVLVRNIRRANPDAHLLLCTPAECQRSTRSGRRRRSRTYTVNAKVERMRQIILRYGREHGIPTYDWYEVAGGDGSSTHWVNNELMSKDRIHCTWSGYALQGSLLYDALILTIEQ